MDATRLAHDVILASAGSGKTWQLTTRYLRLVSAGVDPATIVASTFTRAAAAEIRDRILDRALAAVTSPKAREERGAALGVTLDEAGARRILDILLDAWPRLQVRTLDSLIGGIALSHRLELGLPPGVRIGEELELAA